MNHTTNFNLNQWEDGDRVTREDFNADNAKIDAAVAMCGNCKLVYGTYVGAEPSPAEHPRVFNFDHRPVALFSRRSGAFADGECFFACRGLTEIQPWIAEKLPSVSITWGERSVSLSGSSGAAQMDWNGQLYFYFALLDMEH